MEEETGTIKYSIDIGNDGEWEFDPYFYNSKDLNGKMNLLEQEAQEILQYEWDEGGLDDYLPITEKCVITLRYEGVEKVIPINLGWEPVFNLG